MRIQLSLLCIAGSLETATGEVTESGVAGSYVLRLAYGSDKKNHITRGGACNRKMQPTENFFWSPAMLPLYIALCRAKCFVKVLCSAEFFAKFFAT